MPFTDDLVSVKFAWTGTGTGNVIAGSAFAGYRTPPAGLVGVTVSYEIENNDVAGERENGRAVWSAGTLQRSSGTIKFPVGGPVSFSPGTKEVTLIILVEDLAKFVGLSQLADGTANRLLGYDGAGSPAEIAAGANITISADTISASSGGFGLTTPEDFGAVGDGTTDDTAAVAAAFDNADANGNTVWLNPAKTYLVTADLPAFNTAGNGMQVIGGGTLKAPNGVRLLFHDPTWGPETTITGLSTTLWQGNQTVSVVSLTSTAGLAVGDWVKIGSTTDVIPGAEANPWFESAQIRAVVANTSLTLDRYLEGHRQGILANPNRLFRWPDGVVNVDVGVEADETAQTIFAATNGSIAAEDRGSIGSRVRVRATRWWDRVVQTHGLNAKLEVSWDALPDQGQLGYGVQCAAGAHNVVATVRGGTCRHGFTGGTNALVYDPTRPEDMGMSFWCSTTPESSVSGAASGAYDTHAQCYGYVLRGLAAPGAQQGALSATAKAVQNRGYNTTVAVRATGLNIHYAERAADTDWAAAGLTERCVSTYDAIGSRLPMDGDHVIADGLAGVTGVDVVLRQPIFLAGGAGTAHGVGINSGFEGRVVVSDASCIGFGSERFIRDNSGRCTVEVDGGRIDFVAGANPPFLIDTGAVDRGDGTTGTWSVHGVRARMVDAGTPSGWFTINSALDFNARVDGLVSDLAPMPLRSPGSTGGQFVSSMLHNSTTKPLSRRAVGLGDDAAVLAAAIAGDDVVAPGGTVTSWRLTDGLAGAFSVITGAPTKNADGSVRLVSNEAILHDFLQFPTTGATRMLMVVDAYFDVAGDQSSSNLLMRAVTPGYGFWMNNGTITAQTATGTTSAGFTTISAGRKTLAVFIDASTDQWRIKSRDVDGRLTEDEGTFGTPIGDPAGQSINANLGNDWGTTGRIGTNDFHGVRLLSLPAGLSSDLIDGLILNEMDRLARETGSRSRTVSRALLRRSELRGHMETSAGPSIVAGVLTLDFDLGNYAAVVLDASITSFAINNWPAAGPLATMALRLAQQGSFTADFSAVVDNWINTTSGAAPVIVTGAGRVAYVTFTSSDGGVTVDAFISQGT